MPDGPKLFGDNPRYERWRWQIFGITWLAYAGFYLTRKSFSVAKIELAKPEVMGLSNADMSRIDGAFLLAYAIGQFAWGIAGDKLGPRRVVAAGMLGSVIAAVAMGATSLPLIFGTLFFLQGLCQATGWAPLSKNLSNFFSRRERGVVMGMWASNYAVGGLVASVYAGWMGQWLGWRYCFLIPAFTLFGIWVLFLFLQRNQPEDVGLPPVEVYHHEPADVPLPPRGPLTPALSPSEGEREKEPHPPNRETNAPGCSRTLPLPLGGGEGRGEGASCQGAHPLAQEAANPEPEGSWKIIREVLHNPMVLLLAAVYFCLKPARYAILFWGPKYIHEKLGTGMAASGFLSALFELAGILSVIVAGFLSDKIFGSRRMPVSVIYLGLLAVALYFLDDLPATTWCLGGSLFIIGMLTYAPDSLISGTATVDFGTKKGASTASGLVNGAGSIGAVIGGTLPGLVHQRWGWHGVFTILAAAVLVAAVLLLPKWNALPTESKRTS